MFVVSCKIILRASEVSIEEGLRVLEYRVLRRIFGPKRLWCEAGEDCIMRSFITCTLHQIFR